MLSVNKSLIFLVLTISWARSTHGMLSGILTEPKYRPHIQVRNPEVKKMRKKLNIIEEYEIETISNTQITIAQQSTPDEKKHKCSYYALKQTTGNTLHLGFFPGEHGEDYTILNEYFEQTIAPKKNDLVIYTNSEDDLTINHFAVVIDDFTFESKWGDVEPIYRHRLFDVPAVYGTAAYFLTLKEKYATEKGKQLLLNDIKYKAMRSNNDSSLTIGIEQFADTHGKPLTNAILTGAYVSLGLALGACITYTLNK